MDIAVTKKSVEAALQSCLASLADELGISGPFCGPTEAVCLQNEEICVCLLPAVYSYEIEINLAVKNEGSSPNKFSGDIIQEWLGLPIQPLSFNKDNISEVAALSCLTVKKIFHAFTADSTPVTSLQSARGRVVERSRLRRLRLEAEAAWARKDYISVVARYGEMLPFLTPIERKRREIAMKKAGHSGDTILN